MYGSQPGLKAVSARTMGCGSHPRATCTTNGQSVRSAASAFDPDVSVPAAATITARETATV